MEYLPLVIDSTPEELSLKLKSELNETEDNVRKGLQGLREFITRERIPSRTDDDFLLLFLRVQKFQLKKSQERLRRYCHMRQSLVDLHEKVDLEKICLIMEHQTVGLLPYRDKKGRATFFSRGYAWRRDLFDEEDLAQCALLLINFAMSFSLTSMSGITYIGEARMNSVQDLFPVLKIFKKYIFNIMTLPVRFQKIDILNENYIVSCFYHALRPILPTKLTKRVTMVGKNLTHLQEHYHPSILPFEFGGTMGPLNNENYRDMFLNFVREMKADCMHFKKLQNNQES